MKKLLAVCSLLAAFILGFAVTRVNAPATLPAGSDPSIQADGSPLPPPIPPEKAGSALRADGSPLPPPIPPLRLDVFSFLLADGSPLPPPIPPGFEPARS